MKRKEPAAQGGPGSSKSMMDMTPQEESFLRGAGLIICRDSRGRYITKSFRLDSGLADPARLADTPYRAKQVAFYLDLIEKYLIEEEDNNG